MMEENDLIHETASTEGAGQTTGVNGGEGEPAPAPSAPSDGGLAEISAELDAARRLNEERLDDLRRLQAEFENYKKRTRREKAETLKFANQEIFRRLLPIVDDLERAIQFGRENGLSEDIAQGIDMILKKAVGLMGEFGVEAFACLDQPFDQTRHEPLTTLERADAPENTVVQEFEKGYAMHDRVLRMAKVCISRLPAAGDAKEEANRPEPEPPPD